VSAAELTLDVPGWMLTRPLDPTPEPALEPVWTAGARAWLGGLEAMEALRSHLRGNAVASAVSFGAPGGGLDVTAARRVRELLLSSSEDAGPRFDLADAAHDVSPESCPPAAETPVLETLVTHLDVLRRAALRVGLRLPFARRVFTDVRLRVPVLGTLAVLVSAGFALAAPLVLLWLSAAFLGVPHVVSGLRHVVLFRRVKPMTLGLAALGLGLGVAQLFGAGDWSARGFVLLFALSGAVELQRGRWLLAPVAALGMAFPLPALLVLSHLHALSSLVFLAQRGRARGVTVWPVLLTAALVMALASLGALPFGPLVMPRSSAASLIAEATGATAGPYFRRALFLYAFGQSIHFTAWLKLIPDLDRAATVPQSLRVTLARFRSDFGRLAFPAIVLCVAATLAMLVFGGAAREAYFALTYFHLGLEGAAVLGMLARP
jgi:hypothetical protein